MKSIVYLLINRHNQKLGIEPYLYVGSKRNEGAFAGYLSSSKLVLADVALVGAEHFDMVIIDRVEPDAVIRREREIQTAMNVMHNPIYYNRAIAGGQRFIPPENARWINKNGQQRLIDVKELAKHLDAGWNEGFGVKTCDGRVWVNKDAANRRVSPEKAEELFADGWTTGRTKASFNARRIYITKNGETKSIVEDEMAEYVNAGWAKGRPSRRSDHTWINDGQNNKMIPLTKLTEYSSAGWIRGMM